MSSRSTNHSDRVTFQITVNQLTLSTQLNAKDFRITIGVGELSKITCAGQQSKDRPVITWNHPFLFTAPPSADIVIAVWTLPEELTPEWNKQPVGEKMVTNVASLLASGNIWTCNVPGLLDHPATLSTTCNTSDVLSSPEGHDCLSTLWGFCDKVYIFIRGCSNMPSLFTKIEVEQALLDLCPESHADHTTILDSLGFSYSFCYDKEGKLSDLNRAIEIGEKRLGLCPSGHPEHATALGELSTFLHRMYQIQGNQKDLDRMIEMDQKRFDLCPSGHEHHATALGNLAVTLRLRYNEQGDVADLNRAIEMGQQRLDHYPSGHSYDNTALGNLALALHDRYNKLGNVVDLNRAIDLAEQRLELCPPGHPEHGFALYNLARSFSHRHNLLKSTSDGLRAYNLLKEALRIHPVQHQGFALIISWLAYTILQLNSSPGSQSSNQLLVKVEDAFETYKMVKTCGPAVSLDLWKTAQNWVRNAEKYNHSSVLEAYQTSLNILVHFTSLHTSLDSMHQVLQARVADLANDAFSCAVWHNELQMAVEFLEQGRGILWNQLARFDMSLAALEGHGRKGQDLKNSFTRLSSSLRNLAQGSGGTEPYWRVRDEWQSVVDEIRCQEGLSRFLLPPHFDDLQRAAEDGPVIIINASEYDCDALVVLFDRPPIHVPLEDYPFEDVVRLCNRFSELIQDPHAYGDNRECWLRSMLRELWDNVVEPIVDVLQNDVQLPLHSRIWWCPTSYFTILPFHAAGPHRMKGNQVNLVDLYVSSYTPSLSCLIRTRERARSQRVAYLSSGSTETVSFVAVGQAMPSKDLELSTLPSVEHEIMRIRQETNMPLDRVAFESVTGAGATVEGAIQAFKSHRWAHLACHGAQHSERPFESWFAMGDGKLTLMGIIQERYTHSELAFLSACHTAQGDRSTPDEVLHLAAGMQFAGFNGVIGTLWKVDDAVAHQVVTRFYRKMFEQPVLDSEYAAMALNFAVRHSPEVSLEKRIVFAHIGL
ncbi:hypothetical protein JVU11DRAFT_7372 [Chiua virens]|nr:hypothetical protein JVU11DRAFT_7372 [Chiua virens]